MSRVKSLNSILLVSFSLAASVLAFACSAHREGNDNGAVWFIHATDPHVYLYLKKPGDVDEKAIWDYQQKQDAETFKTFLQTLATLPQKDGPPAFLLITGDFGVDPCLNLKAATPPTTTATTPTDAKGCLAAVDDKERASRVDAFADLLSASPVPDIYFVAGNNDLPFETADDAGLGYFNQFFQDVQTKITAMNANVRLHNLTGCYGPKGGAISECAHDIAGTGYRMIGFPSQSFKNRELKTSYTDNRPRQTAQFNAFRALFDQAVRDGKKVLIGTHVPEMDDPHFLAKRRYAKVEPLESKNQDEDEDNPRSIDSTWNVEKSVLDGWTKVLASDSSVAVLAGHLHDSHKQIYQRPYSWSTLKEHQLGYRKLFLAPPLSVKNQDDSPIQARGFSVVFLEDDHLTNRFYWFDGLTRTFNPEPTTEMARRHHTRWMAGVFRAVNWFWELDHDDGPLERAAVLLIALLAAFLTIIAVWQIPPTDNPLAKKPDDNKKLDEKDTSKAAPEPSPFTTKFGKTVIAGLGGLIFTEIAKMIGNRKPSDDANYFYLVCFIVFFFLLLIFFSASRGLAEAIRSRVAVIHYPLARRASPPRDAGNKKNGGALTGPKEGSGSAFVAWVVRWFWRTMDWLGYWILRVVNWVFSLKVPALTFFDTFINLVQGKNQTTTRALAEVVIDQQKNLIRVADAVRKNLMNLIESKMTNQDASTLPHVRVNISVLSADQSSVYYVSRTPGSSLRPFTKRSVAWVSVFTGQIRWWCEDFENNADKVLLFDNSKGVIADAEDKILLSTYFQDRSGDYGGFVIIPLPWPQRSYGSKYVKGAIHISFRGKHDIYNIWKKDEIEPSASGLPSGSLLGYPTPQRMLEDWCKHGDVRAVLQNAVVALGELLFGFNEIIYRNSLEPDQKD